MIISISGPSSAGKTTLINELRTQIHNCYIQDETFRIFVKDKNINFNDAEEAFNFQVDLLSFTKKLYLTNIYYQQDNLIIMDRCALDSVVYMFLHYYRLPYNKQIKYANIFLQCISDSLELTKQVDKIFLALPKDESIEDDGIRPDIYQYMRNEEIFLFKSFFDREKVIVLPSQTDERIQTICTVINTNH